MSPRKSDDIIGQTLYPSPSASGLKVEVDRYTGEEDTYRCSQCGMLCRVASGVQSSGTENDGDGFVVNDPTTGDPTVNRGGCPFCGSANNKG